MDWFRAVNSCCERTDASFWSEPLNAVSNLAFLVAAWVSWSLARRADDRGAALLALLLALIGVGSFLFHTEAQIWAMLADVIPIQAFILVYLYFATVRFFAAPHWVGLAVSLAFIPVSAAAAALIGATVGPLNGSTAYLPVPLLILGYAVALACRAPEAARGLAIGAALLLLSLLFRTIDAAVCDTLPIGTHFLWHLLNAALLAWMIQVLILASPHPDLTR